MVEFGRVRRASAKSRPRRRSVLPATWSFAPTALRISGNISGAAEFRRMCTCFGRCRPRIRMLGPSSASRLPFPAHRPEQNPLLSNRPRILRPPNRPPRLSQASRPLLCLSHPRQLYQRPFPNLLRSSPLNRTPARPILSPERAPGEGSSRFSDSIRHSRHQPIRRTRHPRSCPGCWTGIQ